MNQPIICLHQGTSLISRVIRWKQRSIHSHVSILMPSGLHYESREGKGVIRHNEFTLTNKTERVDRMVFTTPLTDEEIAAGLVFLEAQVGKPYDWPMVFGFVSRSEHEGPSSEGKYFCSELAAHWAQAMGRKRLFLHRIDPWAVSPGHVYFSPILSLV
jgi:uncharacterized protein YycO